MIFDSTRPQISRTPSDPPSSDPVFREGDRFGEYRILRKLGVGGMASVWLGRHHLLGRLTAIKILRREFSSDERSVRRFIQEARAAASLEDPSIVRIYEIGTVPASRVRFSSSSALDRRGGDGTDRDLFQSGGKPWRRFFRRPDPPVHFIAEEYVPGMNLGLYVRRHGPLSPRQAFVVLWRTAEALRTAANAGVIHRDIKPENILLGDSGEVKVADFGLAFCPETRENADLSLTRVGVTLGTPLFMSPEQAKGEALDIRSDLYSLGVTTFWMLTGRAPFTGETPLSVLVQHLNAPRPSIGEFRPDLSPVWGKTLTRLMAQKREDRFDSPDQFLSELKERQKEFFISPPTPDGEPEDESYFSDLSLAPEEGGDGSDPDRILPPSSDGSHPTFFARSEDALRFTRELDALETTRELQKSLTTITALQKGERRPRRILLPLLLTLASFLLLALLTAFVRTRFFPPDVPLPLDAEVGIQRFDSVEEQWVFATQLGTSDAWQSVIDFFPDASYWTERARKQQAYALMREERFEEARQVFDELVASPVGDRSLLAFVAAGRAWLSALAGDFEEASSILSELRTRPGGTYDRITEKMISVASGIIRDRSPRPSAESD